MTETPRITFNGFLSLEGTGSAMLSVSCGGLPLRVIHDPDRADCAEVPLPGWIWRDVPPGGAATIDWGDQTVEVPREIVHDRLCELMARPVGDLDAGVLVGALDHVHRGALGQVPQSPEMSDWLRQAALATGLEALVADPFTAPTPAPGQDAIAAFGAALRHAPDAEARGGENPTLTLALTRAMELATDAPARKALIQAAAPRFCADSQFPLLVDTLSALGVENPWAQGAMAWERAEALAFSLVRRDHAHGLRVLADIVANPSDWASTPVLAWALRYPFTPSGRDLRGDLRHAIVDGLTRFAEARAPLACAEMIRSTVFVLDKGIARLGSDLAEAVLWRAMRAFGTSPLFWDGIAALVDTGRTVPAELLAGLHAFRALEAGVGTPDPDERSTLIRTGLGRLRNLGVADVQRLLIELSSLQAPDADPVDLAFGDGTNGALELLRTSMAPLAADPLPSTDAALLKALRWAASEIPSAPMADTQRQAMALARAMAAPDAPDAAPSATHPGDIAEQVDTLLPLLVQLAVPETRYSGIGLACALLADLAADGSPHAQSALRALEPEVLGLLRSLPPAEIAQIAEHPFPRSAIARLASNAESGLSEVLKALPAVEPVACHRRPAGLALGPALIDTLVVVVSCRAHLDTRVAALRKGWLADLARMNVPHVILVGGDETHLSGDILQVAAPDTYEGLPEKILAMIDWVLSETGIAHVLKIDDDCHVDPVAWFGDALWRQTDWYGRSLDKSGGGAERGWHQTRSQSEVARLSLETLPGKAIYTDGSTGYALSRAAMAAITHSAGTIEGRRLIAGAFSEDRLIGAMLTDAGFAPNSDNYHSLILRKMHRDGLAVPQWSEGIMPSDHLRHTKVVHFDGVVPVNEVEAARRSRRLQPQRIWSTSRLPDMAYDNGAFCQVSPAAHLVKAAQAHVAVVSVMRNERTIVPHFLDHYRRLGVGGFLIVDNLSDDGTLEYLAGQPDVALFSSASEFRNSDQGTDWKLALMSQFRTGRWSLVADADEFLLLPSGVSLPHHLKQLRPEVNAQRVLMQDMYPQGAFARADFSQQSPFAAAPLSDPDPFLRNSAWQGPFSNGETWTSALRHRLMPGARVDAFVAQKTALVRYLPWMRFSTSMHYATEVMLADENLIFAHFKYNARFAAKAEEETRRGQYWNGAEEYRTYRATGFAMAQAAPTEDGQ